MSVPDPNQSDGASDFVRSPARLSALRRLKLLDTPAEKSFDRIARLATRILDVPIALVSLVDVNRQFFKSCVGLPEPYSSWRETPLGMSFCKHVVAGGEPLILSDVREHPEHRDNDAIPDLGVVAYLGCPLIVDAEVMGTFCVIDTAPHGWTDTEIAIVRDLTELVMTEIRLRAESGERAAALAARDRVLAIVSHDLRAPLQTMLTSAALLDLDDLDEEHKKTIETLRRAAARMNRLVGDLLQVTSLDFERLSIEPAPVSVPEFVDELADDARAAAEERELELVVNAPPLPRINADRERLAQAIMNLLDNSMRLTPAGGRIEVGAQSGDGEIILSVQDTGPGIPEADLPYLFDWKWHAGSNEKASTGLGLSIAKGIVTAHGGTIRAENRDEGGARFSIALPAIND